MEPGLLGRTLVGVLVACGALYLLALRPWRPRRLWARRAPAIDLLVLLSLAAGVAAVRGAPPFERVAVLLVAQTELPATLRAVDERIHALETLPARIWDDLVARLGWAEAPPPEAVPASPPDVVSGTVLAAVTAVVEVIVRAFVYWSSLCLFAVCSVMRLVVGVRRALAAATVRRPDPLLEARLAELEETLVTLRASGERALARRPPV